MTIRRSMPSTMLGHQFVVFTILAVLLAALPSTALAQAVPVQERTLTVVGTADVRVNPDLAVVQLGVVTEATTAAEAREQNAARAERVIAAIRALGVPANAIQTSLFQVEAIIEYDQDGRRQPRTVGYRVSNVVTVRTTNLNLVPRIIDESIRAGANRVDNVSFVLSNEAEARQRALRAAVQDARANAQAMARDLGVSLVRVHSAQQGGAVVPPPYPVLFRGGAAAMEASTPTPIFPGEVTVNATVTVTYVIR